MSPVYTYATFAQAKQQLANRLYDATKQFWADAELGVYLVEALRTWNALTAYWRNEFTFPSQQNVTWYDLTDTAAMPATLRPYTVTDNDIYTAIQYHLLEPAVPISPWTGVSAQFTSDDVINATLRRRDEILSVTGCTLNRRLVPAVAGRIALPDTVIDVRRMAYLPATGSPSVVWPDDAWGEQSFNQAYLQAPPGTPSAYLLSTEPPISFDVDRAPSAAGNYELLTVESNDVLSGVGLTPLAADSFNRANQNPANTNWKSLQGSFVAGQVINNQYVGQDVSEAEMLYDGGIAWPSDQYSRAALRTLNAGKGFAVLTVRQHIGSGAANGDGYGFTMDGTGVVGGIGLPTPVQLDKISGGVSTVLVSGTVTPQIGDIFALVVAGTTITAYQNGVAIPGLKVSDASVASGNPGIGASPTLGVAADIAWDNWDGGSATNTGLLLPDDWTHVLKWGALADLLSRESNAKDPLRATYCEQRYRMGVTLLAAAPALLAMRIGNVPLQVDAVRGADQYQTTWQAAAAGTPKIALQAGLNKVALTPAADAGPYSLTAIVVQNAPIPTANGDLMQVGRDIYDALLDYAQHLAAFKMGGAEFLATIPLFQRFLKQAAVNGLKLAELGEYTSVLFALSSREEQMNPRMAPEPPEASNG